MAMLSIDGKSWQNSLFPPFFPPGAVCSAEDKAHAFAQSRWRELLWIKMPERRRKPGAEKLSPAKPRGSAALHSLTPRHTRVATYHPG